MTAPTATRRTKFRADTAYPRDAGQCLGSRVTPDSTPGPIPPPLSPGLIVEKPRAPSAVGQSGRSLPPPPFCLLPSSFAPRRVLATLPRAPYFLAHMVPLFIGLTLVNLIALGAA